MPEILTAAALVGAGAGLVVATACLYSRAGAARQPRLLAEECLLPGCNKPTFNGKPGEYCGKGHQQIAITLVSPATCELPGCNKPAWNGQRNEFCSKSHKAQGAGGPVCGCGKPTWNGQWQELCTRSCAGPKLPGPAAGAVAGGRGYPTGTNQPLTQIHTHEAKYKDLQNQFTKKWDPLCGRVPAIKSMWLIHNQSLLDNFDKYCKDTIGPVKLFGAGTNPGNQQRRFHRTSMECQSRFRGSFCSSPTCKGCSIMKTGFLKKFLNHAPTWKHYGIGFYSSPSSSYGLSLKSAAAASKFADGAVFVCKVGVGVADITDTTAALPHGTHSRVASSTTPNPDDSELVAFEEAQMVPRYLIIF